MSRGGSRQDYIARVRYRNDLPPPPCPPKLLEIPIDTQKLTSCSFLSDLARKQAPDLTLDIDLGMPLDMTALTGIFDRGDESSVYPQDPPPVLNAKDSILLREPGGSGAGARAQPSVSFLRRTEYISSEVVRQKIDINSAKNLRQQQQQKQRETVVDPEAQLRTVESTFEATSTPLEKIRHPTKKHLKAVETFAVLPDFKQLDLTYLAVKMLGSAALSQEKKKISDDSLAVSIFRPTSLEDDEWMSFFVPTKEDSARSLKRKLDDPADTLENDEDKVYRFTHHKDYEMELIQHSNQFAEIAINFDKKNSTATFVPVAGRTKLKHRRIVESQRALVNEHNVAAIDLSLREVTAEESIIRDNARSEFDPISYTAVETRDESDEEET